MSYWRPIFGTAIFCLLTFNFNQEQFWWLCIIEILVFWKNNFFYNIYNKMWSFQLPWFTRIEFQFNVNLKKWNTFQKILTSFSPFLSIWSVINTPPSSRLQKNSELGRFISFIPFLIFLGFSSSLFSSLLLWYKQELCALPSNFEGWLQNFLCLCFPFRLLAHPHSMHRILQQLLPYNMNSQYDCEPYYGKSTSLECIILLHQVAKIFASLAWNLPTL